ncbi:hypothetical protein PENSPDRAFT_684904 [Peniophora sp. CONT]|nr:hypothetical protein PENSPDRAFT_684904 [Peniophora sp. CONT]
MPSTSALTSTECDKVKSSAGPNGAKIPVAGLARIYFAYPDPTPGQTFYLRVVDLVGTRGALWEFEVYWGVPG